MRTGRLMSAELMDELWDALRRAGCPAPEAASPGLSRDEIENRLAAVKLWRPEEVLVWWNYQDGIPGAEDLSPMISPRKQIISLSEALDLRSERERINWDLIREDRMNGRLAEAQWEDSWLPILKYGRHLVVADCSKDHPITTPLRHVMWDGETSSDMHAIRASSIGTMVRMWTDAIRDGLWRWDSTSGRWNDTYWSEMTPTLRATGFM